MKTVILTLSPMGGTGIMNQQSQKQQKPLWRYAVGVFGSHVAAVIIAMIIVVSILPISENIVFQVCCGLFTLLLYWALVNGSAWKLGNDDLNRVNFGRMEKNLWRGVQVGLLASIPMFVLDLALIVLNLFDCGAASQWGLVVYRVLNMHYIVFLNLVAGTDATLLDLPVWKTLIICLMSLVTTACTTVGYLLGYKDIVLMDKLMYKNRKGNRK